jgi:hypothetical protein
MAVSRPAPLLRSATSSPPTLRSTRILIVVHECRDAFADEALVGRGTLNGENLYA